MKKFSIIAVCAVLAAAGCTKNVLDYGDVEKLTGNETLLKINYNSMYANNRSVVFKINDKRVSGLLTSRSPFPGGGYNTGGDSKPDFLVVDPGSINLSVVLPKKVDNGTDSIVLYSTTLELAAGKKYSVHIADTLATTKNLLVEENFAMPDSSFARYRFVNLLPNVPAVDLYYGPATATVGDQSLDTLKAANIGFMQASPEFVTKSAAARTWKIRPAGAAKTSATIIASYLSASTLLERRVYTAFATGYSGKTTAAQRPYVSFYLVR